MKKEEKTRLSRERILNAALEEFGTQSYENASLNHMCETHHISKGLLYHNFENKDALYLTCVSACYSDMMKFMMESEIGDGDVRQEIQAVIARRQTFFRTHPAYSRIFFQTVLQPPRHLLEPLREIRREFDAFNAERFRGLLERIPLRSGLSVEQAMKYFFMFQEMYNIYFQSRVDEEADLNDLIRDHELRLNDMLDILLYGMVQRDEKN